MPAPAAIAEGWRVEIPMPLFFDGRDRGKPVGWLNLNSTGGGVRADIRANKVKKTWRLAARDAYRQHRVPQGLDRIYVQIELRFPTRNKNRNISNYEWTFKPIIDALQVERTKMGWNPVKKRKEPMVDYGHGVILDDSEQYLVRGPYLPEGEPLGTKSPIKGMAVVYITPMPPLETQR